ncbi:MAG: hypothetical protein NVS2B17_30180 [Candidatus Velthaea sp.]
MYVTLPLSVELIEFSGDLDISRYPEFRSAFQAALAASGCVLVDIGDVANVDSVFLTELLLLKRHLGKDGRRLAVVVRQPNLMRMLEVTFLRRRLDVYSSRPDAEQSLRA